MESEPKRHEIPEELIGADLPSVLLPYQQKLLASTALNAVTLCEKSRRIGMTWGVGADAVLHAAANKKAGGMDVLYIAFNLEMTREFIDVCAMWAKAFSYAAGEVEEFVFEEQDENGNTKEIKAFRISFASGFEIMALSSKPRSIRGRQGFVIIDEAAFHDELDELMKAAVALLMWGGKILVISTHDGVDNAFNKLIQNARAGQTNHAVLKVDFKEALKDGLYKRICLVKGVEWTKEGEAEWEASIRKSYGPAATEELDCVPRKSAGSYFPSALVEPCMAEDIPVLHFDQEEEFFLRPKAEKERITREFCETTLAPFLEALDPKLPCFFGQDFARHGHLSVIVPLQMQKNTSRRAVFQLEMRKIPYDQQKQILFFIVERLPRFQGGAVDSTGSGEYIGEAATERFGVERIHAVKMNAAWYHEAFPKYRAALEQKNITIVKDANTLQDHATAQMVGGVPQIPVKKDDEGKDRHGDSLVAIALAYWASLQNPVSYDYQPAFSEPLRHGKMTMRPPQNEDLKLTRSKTFGNDRGAW